MNSIRRSRAHSGGGAGAVGTCAYFIGAAGVGDALIAKPPHTAAKKSLLPPAWTQQSPLPLFSHPCGLIAAWIYQATSRVYAYL